MKEHADLQAEGLNLVVQGTATTYSDTEGGECHCTHNKTALL